MNVKVKLNQIIQLKIKKLGINGEGIGYYQRKIVFVPGALPNEMVKVKITDIRPKYLSAKLIKVLKASKERVDPRDKYEVGGIELENLAYPAQLKFKQDLIQQALNKFEPQGYQHYDVRPTIGMEYPYEYRNKAQFQVRKMKDGTIKAGLYQANSHYLVDLPTFSTQMPLTMKIMRTIVQLLKKWNVSIYDEKRNQGNVKTIVIRQSAAFDQVQVVFVTNQRAFPQKNDLIVSLQRTYPQIVSIMQNVNPGRKSLVWGTETFRLAGKDTIDEQLGNVKFKLSARAFFQLNPQQTLKLYDEVKQALDLHPDETLVDAYCGVGTIGLYVGQNAKQIRGMDIIPESIADAQQNAQMSGIKNVHYETGTAEELMTKWAKNGFVPDALVVDPPRTGLDKQLVETIHQYQPQKFVYVSCNPSTLARDLVKLVRDYEVEYIQSIDMFPQTARCEAIVKFKKK
ncbi:MAG TPA: 23S rRNA (uracil(1939)-C(5))-methyltransferase RlmD [Candidatus Ligilactobacillus excrementigallinarum]|uniref:23S rRNA (Uracil(1939)-C(5))-methyltransferase RlmD n=1 Tax=Candidatus Ligilactobacillus excrementigallinarum TaxID=2838641 RepID=A0A9D1UWE7_9LACO|nr:23S rRNA (uracil(1939)-C(5))-methyltransferase RlmD [Candidatus Ligilactobacillus excrementigallinarum]